MPVNLYNASIYIHVFYILGARHQADNQPLDTSGVPGTSASFVSESVMYHCRSRTLATFYYRVGSVH